MHTLAAALVLVIRAYDMSGMPPHEMASAERAAAEVLHHAGIELAWVSCQPEPAAACTEVPQPSELIVRLITRPSLAADAALADATVDIESVLGSLATVYVDRISTLAAAAGIDAGTLIGRAIAHEVAHLLLGTSVHSATGLMRAAWSAPALRRDGAWGWTFSGREAGRLRARLRARLELDRVARSAIVEPLSPGLPCSSGPGIACPSR